MPNSEQYTISQHFLCPITYGDYSGLEDNDIEQLENFMEEEGLNGQAVTLDDEHTEDICDITGQFSSCVLITFTKL